MAAALVMWGCNLPGTSSDRVQAATMVVQTISALQTALAAIANRGGDSRDSERYGLARACRRRLRSDRCRQPRTRS